jgi:hypothetical protein
MFTALRQLQVPGTQAAFINYVVCLAVVQGIKDATQHLLPVSQRVRQCLRNAAGTAQELTSQSCGDCSGLVAPLLQHCWGLWCALSSDTSTHKQITHAVWPCAVLCCAALCREA